MSSELKANYQPDDRPDDLIDRFVAADERRLQGDHDWISCSIAGLVPDAADKLNSLLECVELLARAGSSFAADKTITFQRAAEDPVDRDDETPRHYAGYRILSELGRGGFGIVYRGRHEHMQRDVAIKVPALSLLGSQEALRRFQLEARAVANLNHPNIVTIHEASAGSQPAIVYEYCDGGTLSHFVKTLERPLTESAILQILICLAEALRHAHSRGVLHRDIKPGNVLICSGSKQEHFDGFEVDGQRWVPKLADFGLAKILDEQSELTQTHQIMGTVSFMAPEQATGQSSEADTRTDIYSLGAVLYWLISGRPPFESATKISTLRQIETQRPQPPRRIRPDVSVELELVCLKSLEKTAADRYESVASMLADLKAIRAGDPVSLRPAGMWRRLRQWARYHQLEAVGLAAVCLAILLFSSLQFWHNSQQKSLITELDRRNNELREAVQVKAEALLTAESSQ
jgi:serine/threonine protein kinase